MSVRLSPEHRSMISSMISCGVSARPDRVIPRVCVVCRFAGYGGWNWMWWDVVWWCSMEELAPLLLPQTAVRSRGECGRPGSLSYRYSIALATANCYISERTESTARPDRAHNVYRSSHTLHSYWTHCVGGTGPPSRIQRMRESMHGNRLATGVSIALIASTPNKRKIRLGGARCRHLLKLTFK